MAGLLAWYRQMGISATICEQAIDWTETGRSIRTVNSILGEQPTGTRRNRAAFSPVSATPSSNAPTSTPPTVAETEATNHSSKALTRTKRHAAPGALLDDPSSVAEARTLAQAAKSLSELEKALSGFDGCPLKRTAKSLCFMRGSHQARLMVIGEGPGRDEDRLGKPFVGRAGQLLDQMLAAIGHSEDNCHITNVVYWRPPGNRAPTEFETMVCRPFLERQIALVDPDVVLLLGGSSAKTILATTTGIMKTRGKWHQVDLGGRPRRVLATLHPAYLLRVPTSKQQVWTDLLAVEHELGSRS